MMSAPDEIIVLSKYNATDSRINNFPIQTDGINVLQKKI
jgi:hypothetical protein